MSFHIAYNIISTFICGLVCVVQIIAATCHWQKYPWNSDTSLVLCLIFTIFLINMSCCVFGLLLTFGCSICSWAGVVIQILYSTCKLATYLFYLQRAKLAQTFRRKIPIYYFNKVFPVIFVAIYLIFLSLFMLVPNARDTGQCVIANEAVPFIKSDIYHVKQWCSLNTKDSKAYINSGLFIEVFATIFFCYLFSSPLVDMLKPMYKNNNDNTCTSLKNPDSDTILNDVNTLWHIDIRKKTNVLNSAKVQKHDIDDNSKIPSDFSMFIAKHGKKLKEKHKNDVQTLKAQQAEIERILIFNVIFSLIGFIFSSFTMILWPIQPETFWWIPWTDYYVNSITTFLMLSRNRALVKRFVGCCCCCCVRFRRKRSMRRIIVHKKKRDGIKSNTTNKKLKAKFTIHTCNSYDEDFSSTNNYYHHIGISHEYTSTRNSINCESSIDNH